ncbi:hypothetical protein Tco_1547097 [Tanacetum coccineum]
MIIKKDSEIVKAKVERKSLALKAKKESSDEECSTSGSEDEEYAMAVRDFKKFFKRRGRFVRQPRNDKKTYQRNRDDKNEGQRRNVSCSSRISERNGCKSSYFSDENSSIDDIALDNEYDKLCKMSLKIITKNKKLKATRISLENELRELKDKLSTLEKNKGVDLDCAKCYALKIENEKLKDESTRLNKFEKSTHCLNEMLSNQKPSGNKLGLGFNSFEASSSGTKEIKFVKAQKKACSDGGPIIMGGPLNDPAAPIINTGPPPVMPGSKKTVSFQKSILGPRPKHIIVNKVKVPVASDNEVKQFYKPLSKPGVGFSKPNLKSTNTMYFWHITAKVAGKSVSISEASIRTDLLFDDANGIDTLPNQAIFDAIQQMGHLEAKKKFVMYPRFISIFVGKQLANVSVPLDHFPVNTLTSKVFSFMVKKGKHFSGKVTPLFTTMLVQPTQDEGASSERPTEALPTPSPAPTSEIPLEPQPDSSPAQTSEVPIEHQSTLSPRPQDLSPRPSPTPTIPDSLPETSGENLGGHSSSDRSLSGNEGDMTLQSVYDLCLSLCAQVSDQAKEIQDLKAKITKLKKQAKPVIKHHKAYLKSISMKQRFPRKSFSKKHRMHKEYVSKQGRKYAKGESLVQRDPLFDEVPEDTVDHMDTENAQVEGRTRETVDEDKEIEENVLSTDKERVSTDIGKVSTDRPIVSTEGSKVSTDKHIEGTDEQIEGTDEQVKGTEEQVESTDGHKKDQEVLRKYKLLYEKIIRVSDEDFSLLGSTEDERLIKRMNEKGVGLSKSEVIKEESKEEVHEEDKDEESTRKRKLALMKKNREDLNAVYQLVMEKYQDEMPKGFDRVLWGDLMKCSIQMMKNEFSHPYAGREEVSFEKGSTDARC